MQKSLPAQATATTLWIAAVLLINKQSRYSILWMVRQGKKFL
jgi:hypothetical protein